MLPAIFAFLVVAANANANGRSDPKKHVKDQKVLFSRKLDAFIGFSSGLFLVFQKRLIGNLTCLKRPPRTLHLPRLRFI